MVTFRPRPSAQASSPVSEPAGSVVNQRLAAELQAMALYALGAGLQLPAGVMTACNSRGGDAEQHAQQHAALARLIFPATPRAVLVIQQEERQHPRLAHMAPIAIMRHMLLIACMATALLLVTSLSPTVNHAALAQGLLDGSGMTLFLAEIFLIAAAAVGSSFAALFKLNRYVSEGTYDPRYASSYWVQLVLGIISGLVLSQLLFHYIQKEHGAAVTSSLDQPLLALLGGFSSSLVYRVLTRMLAAVESLFGADAAAAGSAELHPNRSQVADPETCKDPS